VRIDTFLTCTQLERKNLRKLDPELREGAIVSVSTVPNSNVIILSVFLEGRVQRKRYKNVVFFNTAVLDISLPQDTGDAIGCGKGGCGVRMRDTSYEEFKTCNVVTILLSVMIQLNTVTLFA